MAIKEFTGTQRPVGKFTLRYITYKKCLLLPGSDRAPHGLLWLAHWPVAAGAIAGLGEGFAESLLRQCDSY